MKITFIRGTSLGGIGNDAHPGDVRDLPDSQANDLIRRGRAVAGAARKSGAKPPTPVPPPSEVREPDPIEEEEGA